MRTWLIAVLCLGVELLMTACVAPARGRQTALRRVAILKNSASEREANLGHPLGCGGIMKPELPDGHWEHIGIPGRSRIDTLLYSRTAESLVAVTSRRLEDGLEVQRLYYRRLPWELYSPVSTRHPMESQRDAICCWDAPFLFFNVWRYHELEPKSWYPSDILRRPTRAFTDVRR
jgi:hypothetical protein